MTGLLLTLLSITNSIAGNSLQQRLATILSVT